MTPAGIALVVASVLLDLPSALLRLLLAAVVLGAFGHLGTASDVVASLVAFGPPARSLLALVVPFPAPLAPRAASGGRRPSGREQEALAHALALLPGTSAPRDVVVVDSPDENAWVLGGSLFVARGLFDSPHLVPVVAHEAGHLAGGDGRVALAAWWLPLRSLAWLAQRLLAQRLLARQAGSGGPARTLPQPQARGEQAPAPRLGGRVLRLPLQAAGVLLLALSGGLLPMLLRPGWAAYRRSREYAADAFATRRGLGSGLADALADWQVLDLATPWWQGRSHPYVEQRLDHIRRIQEGRG